MTIYARFIIVAVLIAGPLLTQAQPTPLQYVPLEPLPGFEDSQTGQGSFAELVNDMFRLLINLGAFFAVVVLVLGGISYMFSEATVKKLIAKERIRAALVGLGILAAAWLILNTINPQLVSFNPDLLNPTGSSAPVEENVTATSRAYGACTPGGLGGSMSGGEVTISPQQKYYEPSSSCATQLDRLVGTLQPTSKGYVSLVLLNNNVSTAGASVAITEHNKSCADAGGKIKNVMISNATAFTCIKP